MPLSVPRD